MLSLMEIHGRDAGSWLGPFLANAIPGPRRSRNRLDAGRSIHAVTGSKRLWAVLVMGLPHNGPGTSGQGAVRRHRCGLYRPACAAGTAAYRTAGTGTRAAPAGASALPIHDRQSWHAALHERRKSQLLADRLVRSSARMARSGSPLRRLPPMSQLQSLSTPCSRPHNCPRCRQINSRW